MRLGKGRGLARGLVVLLILVLLAATGVAAWGKMSLHSGNGGQPGGEAGLWYKGEWPQVCGTPYVKCDTVYGDQWNAELGTYFEGEWADVQLDCADRFNIEDVTGDMGFTYKMVDPNVQTGPRLAFWLTAPDGTNYFAYGSVAGTQTGSCKTFTDDGLTWFFATVETDTDTGTTAWPDLSTLGSVKQVTFADLQTKVIPDGLKGSSVEAVLVVLLPNPTTEKSQALVDYVVLGWTGPHGGTYHLEEEWDETIGFDDWTQTPLPSTEEPREFDKWCTDVALCAHCLKEDSQNLWNLISQTDLSDLDIPEAAKTFPSPEYALYFGDPVKGNYDKGEAAIGTICSPWNELNPGDEYVSVTFDYFRQVEQYMGQYDMTFVQILFGNDGPSDPWGGLAWDPREHSDPVNKAYQEPLPAKGPCYDWKTIWYKDSSDPNEGAWTTAVTNHYVDADGNPYTTDEQRIIIPPQATRMRIRFGFNSVDGASNNYLGWIVDNIKKEHTPKPTGCVICTKNLPQAEVGLKYDEELCPVALAGSTSGARYWEIKSVTKDGRPTTLPNRLALDPYGRLYGTPDTGTIGTYQIEFLLTCWNGRLGVTLTLTIRSPSGSTSNFYEQDFGPSVEDPNGVDQPGWSLTVGGGCPNLWHQTKLVKYALDDTDLTDVYGDVAYFGQQDTGTPKDPNFMCGRAKGCFESPMIPIGAGQDGEELIIGFKSWRNVEYTPNADYDKTWVEVRAECGGTWTTVWSKSSSEESVPAWMWEEAHTGITLKKGCKIQVRFCFDSVDGYKNGETGKAFGWLVDEISLYAGSAELSITNCPREQTSVGEAYKEKIHAAGGSIQPVWEISAGALPPGLGLVTGSVPRDASIEGVARETGTFDFTIRVRDEDWKEVATRDCTITVGRDVTLLCEDFEDDPAWSQGGLWHFTGDVKGVPDLALIGNHAAYYGREDATNPNYNTGATTSGYLTLVTPTITIPGGTEAIAIVFDYYRVVEKMSGGGAFDKTQVQVKLNGGAWKTAWGKSSLDVCDTDWHKGEKVAFLTSDATTMAIRFVFDSVDKWFNTNVGWLIDNLCISTTPKGDLKPLSALGMDEDRGRPRDPASDLRVLNIPNPVTDVSTTTFMVRSEVVEAIKVQIFDLAYNLIFEETVADNELVWHTVDSQGQYLANGIYLYRAIVFVDGEWIPTEFQKLVILR